MSRGEGAGGGRRLLSSMALLIVAFLAGWFGHAFTADRPATETTPHPVGPRDTVDERPDDRQVDTPRLQGRPVGQEAPDSTQSDAEANRVRAAKRYAASSTSIRYIREPERMETGSLRVQVRHPSGEPVSGVAVEILCHMEKPASYQRTSDTSGLVEFDGLPERLWRVECVFTGGSLTLTVAVFAGCTTEIDMALPTMGSTFEGLITHVISGPVEGETVSLTSIGDWSRAKLTTQTDSDGWYRFDGVPPGTWSVHLASWRSDSGFSRSTSDLVAPGRTIRRDFSVGPRLRGTVRNLRTNAPVAGARVQCAAGHRMLDRTTSDSEGVYAFRSQLPSKLSLRVSKEGYAFTVVRDIVIPEEGTVVDVNLPEAAKLRLRVTDSQRDPVSGSLIITAAPKVEGQGSLISTNIILDAEGGGFCDKILPGTYELTFSAEGIGVARVDVTLDLGENVLEIRLE